MGKLKDMLSRALEVGVCFFTGPVLGKWVDVPLLGPLREGINFFFVGRDFTGEFERQVKEDSGNGQLSASGPPWGTCRAFVYWGFLRLR